MWMYLVLQLLSVVLTPPKAEKPTLAHLMKMKSASGEKIQIIKQIAPQWKQLSALLTFDPEGWISLKQSVSWMVQWAVAKQPWTIG